MRTTLNLEDDALDAAKTYAQERSIALGKAVSELVMRGVHRKLGYHMENGLAVFNVPPDSPTITTEMVKELLAEEE